MQKSKAKRDHNPLPSRTIVVLWALIHALGWLVIYMMAVNTYSFWNDYFMLGFIGLLAGGVTGALQHTLVDRGINVNLKHWVVLSALGLSAGLVSVQLLSDLWFYSPYLYLLPVFLVPSLFQWWSIRRNTQAGGLWIVGNMVASAVFVMFVLILDDQGYELMSAIIPAGLQGIVSGFVVVWLLRQLPKQQLTSDKQKIGYDHHTLAHSDEQ